MKIVDFIRVDIEGFGSIQDPFTFEFNHSGINVLRGENGTGKTSVFNALAWGLYGVNLKGVTKDRVSTWVHLRKPSFKGTRVFVVYVCDGNTYEVARHIAYKGKTGEHTGGDSMMVFINEELKSTGIQDSTKLVEDSLGINARMFLNSVLFGQRMKKLIEADDEDKRKVFDELFDAEWVGGARLNIKAKHDVASKSVETLTADVASKDSMIGFVMGTKEKLMTDKEWFDRTKADNIITLTREVNELSNSLYNVQQELKQFKGLDPLHLSNLLWDEERLVGEITRITGEWNAKKEELSQLTSSMGIVKTEMISMDKQLASFKVDKDIFYKTKNNSVITMTSNASSMEKEGDLIAAKKERVSKVQRLDEEGITPSLLPTYAEYSNRLKDLANELSEYDRMDRGANPKG